MKAYFIYIKLIQLKISQPVENRGDQWTRMSLKITIKNVLNVNIIETDYKLIKNNFVGKKIRR